jgi:hypothetical protein
MKSAVANCLALLLCTSASDAGSTFRPPTGEVSLTSLESGQGIALGMGMAPGDTAVRDTLSLFIVGSTVSAGT